jgi:hypothetical protein
LISINTTSKSRLDGMVDENSSDAAGFK